MNMPHDCGPRRAPSMLALASVAAACFALGWTASHSQVAQNTKSNDASPKLSSLLQLDRYSERSDNATSGLSVKFTNEYTTNKPVYSPDYDVVIEPHRTTTMALHDSNDDGSEDVRYVWLVDGTEIARGKEVEYFFRGTKEVPIKIRKERMTASGVWVKTEDELNVDAVCKYVRRELRALSDHDRNEFFEIVLMMYTVGMKEGQSIYGPAYRDMNYFGRLHTQYGADIVCDHWHEGAGFMIAHVAVTMEFEQAVQAVSPHLTVPYWDFTLESMFYTVEDWRKSKVFSEDWFGDATPKNSLRTVTSGRFAYAPILTNAWNYTMYTNSYGLMRGPWNNDPTPYVTRSDMICGYPNNLKPRQCSGFHKCLKYKTWYSLYQCLNTDAHGHIHELFGGSWDGDWHAGTNRSFEYLGGHFFDDWHNLLHLNLGYSKKLWRAGYLYCPEYCALDSPREECRCSCNRTAIEDTTPYGVLYDTGIAHSLWFYDLSGSHMEKYTDTENSTQYRVRNITEDLQNHIWTSFAANLCSIGVQGDHYSSSSAMDVSFWTMHPTIERLWHWTRLSSNSSNFDDSWDFMNSCPGHNYNDTTPWTAELFGQASQGFLTNGEMYQLLHPSSGSLPYVYEHFEWSHCAAAGYDMSYTGTDDVYDSSSFFT